MKVLVVDDEESIRRLLCLTLERLNGWDVAEASNGAAALAAAHETPFDLILLDYRMPEIDGVEVCRRLRARPETASTPIVMVTAATEKSDRDLALQAGASDYVVKPFLPLDLRDRLRALVGQGAANPETPRSAA